MRFPPPEVTATWPEPTYINPERRGDANMIVQIILVTIATAFVAIRIYARLVITRARIGLDDGIIIISWVRPTLPPQQLTKQWHAWTIDFGIASK